MDEIKFLLGQTVYSAQKYRIGRYVVNSFVTTETADGVTTEIVVEDPTGRKEGYSQEDIDTYFFATLDEARELALQNWKIICEGTRKQLEDFTDETFDEAIKEMQEAKEAKKKAKETGNL